MKILVTGGAGFIGSNLVYSLVEKGFDVYVIDNLHSGNLQNLKEIIDKIKFIKADAKEINNLNLPKIDLIFHLGIYSSSPMYKENPYLVSEAIQGAISILEYAKKNNSKIIIASTSSIYNGLPVPWKEDMVPIPTDYYTEARFSIERIAKVYSDLFGIQIVILRYFSVYGEKEEFKGKYANVLTQMIWSALKNEEFKIFGNGEQKRDLIYVKDVVNANIKAMEFLEQNVSKYEIFNVGFGKSYSFNEIAEMLKKFGLNLKIKYVENPIKNYVFETLANTEKSEKLLKFKAKTELKEGIRKTINYYKNIYYEI